MASGTFAEYPHVRLDASRLCLLMNCRSRYTFDFNNKTKLIALFSVKNALIISINKTFFGWQMPVETLRVVIDFNSFTHCLIAAVVITA